MGFWDGWGDGASVTSRKSHKSSSHKSSSHKHKRSKSPSRSPSPSHKHRKHGHSTSGLGAIFGNDSHYTKHNASRGSFFNLGNASTKSFFSVGRSPSYYKRSPRSNFMTRAYKKLKRLVRDLIYYAKRHPMKVFMLVIMPLITGGALTALLARFGLRLPQSITRMMGIAAKTASGDGIGLVGEAVRMASGLGGNGSASIERGYDNGYSYERRQTTEFDYGGHSGGGGGFFNGLGKIFS
ncbi:hypothetical protein GGR57DRAFT_249927 [Xylariaceae sp. FL1272]|nr:hypothetical protein GGR57DRAFT_249927 [Xylariaceae sp. FL1272]